MAAPEKIGTTESSGGTAITSDETRENFKLGLTANFFDKLLGGIGSLFGNDLARQNAEYQWKLQKDMLDYQWKHFSSPKAQARSLAEAGINPSVAFGQGSVSHSAQPSMGGVSPISPIDIGLSGSDFASSILALSQAKKAGSEEAGQKIDNLINKSTIDDHIKRIGLENKWTNEQISKTTTEIGLMVGKFNETQANIDKLRSEKQLTDKDIQWYDRKMEATINEIMASADYQNMLKGKTESEKKLLDDSMEHLKKFNEFSAKQLETLVGLMDKYGDASAIINMGTAIMNSVSNLIGNFVSPWSIYQNMKKGSTQVK